MLLRPSIGQRQTRRQGSLRPIGIAIRVAVQAVEPLHDAHHRSAMHFAAQRNLVLRRRTPHTICTSRWFRRSGVPETVDWHSSGCGVCEPDFCIRKWGNEVRAKLSTNSLLSLFNLHLICLHSSPPDNQHIQNIRPGRVVAYSSLCQNFASETIGGCLRTASYTVARSSDRNATNRPPGLILLWF